MRHQPATAAIGPTRLAASGGLKATLGRSEGFSVLEVLIAATLVSVAFGAIFGALSAGSFATIQNNREVQVEAALAQAKQTLALAAFDPTGNYNAQFPILSPAACTIGAQGCLSVVLSPKPAAAEPNLNDITKLQAVGLLASLESISRTATVYKGSR